jgi:RNA polymerase sigma-70 factor, ECF subfamily
MQDKELLTREFLGIVRDHDRVIRKVCSLYTRDRNDHEDLYQEIMTQVWLALPRFRQEAKISTWLYRVALNVALSHRRKNTKKPLLVAIDPDMNTQSSDTNDNDEFKIMWHVISSLPPLDKALILLYLEDNSHDEIAAIMGISATNVGTKLGRIKERMRRSAQTIIEQ